MQQTQIKIRFVPAAFYTANPYVYTTRSICFLEVQQLRIKPACRTCHMTFNIVKSYENRRKISILTQTVSYFRFSFSANSQTIILIYNSRKFSLSKKLIKSQIKSGNTSLRTEYKNCVLILERSYPVIDYIDSANSFRPLK